jgi:hypothetical protein
LVLLILLLQLNCGVVGLVCQEVIPLILGRIRLSVVVEHLAFHEIAARSLDVADRAEAVHLFAHFCRLINCISCLLVIIECLPRVESIIGILVTDLDGVNLRAWVHFIHFILLIGFLGVRGFYLLLIVIFLKGPTNACTLFKITILDHDLR